MMASCGPVPPLAAQASRSQKDPPGTAGEPGRSLLANSAELLLPPTVTAIHGDTYQLGQRRLQKERQIVAYEQAESGAVIGLGSSVQSLRLWAPSSGGRRMHELISTLGGSDAKDRENVVLQPAGSFERSPQPVPRDQAGGVVNFDWAAGATLLVCAVFGAGYVFKLIDRLSRERRD